MEESRDTTRTGSALPPPPDDAVEFIEDGSLKNLQITSIDISVREALTPWSHGEVCILPIAYTADGKKYFGKILWERVPEGTMMDTSNQTLPSPNIPVFVKVDLPTSVQAEGKMFFQANAEYSQDYVEHLQRELASARRKLAREK